MSSHTYNVIGVASEHDGQQRLYPAMSRVEMAQQAVTAERFDGEHIESWYAQTRAGERMIEQGPSRRVEKCRICGGAGRKLNVDKKAHCYCPVCSGSGVAAVGVYRKWRDWQLDMMRADFAS